MYKKQSTDPRSIRARKLLRDAFLELLDTKEVEKISIKDIVESAGLARPTFYNHYESKEEFYYYLIADVLDPYFANWIKGVRSIVPDKEEWIETQFFVIWKENSKILNFVKRIDINCALIPLFQGYFRKIYYVLELEKRYGFPLSLAEYVINLNAYTFVGFLQQWIKDDMKYEPELMGELLYHFTHPNIKIEAISKYSYNFK